MISQTSSARRAWIWTTNPDGHSARASPVWMGCLCWNGHTQAEAVLLFYDKDFFSIFRFVRFATFWSFSRTLQKKNSAAVWKRFQNDFSKNVVFMSIVKNSKRKRHLLKKVRATFSFLLAASQYRVFKASSIFIVKLVF